MPFYPQTHRRCVKPEKAYSCIGKELDRETGFFYYGVRCYEAKISRWMSADPVGFELVNPHGKANPGGSIKLVSGLNWYAYVEKNPVKYTDPMEEVVRQWWEGKKAFFRFIDGFFFQKETDEISPVIDPPETFSKSENSITDLGQSDMGVNFPGESLGKV